MKPYGTKRSQECEISSWYILDGKGINPDKIMGKDLRELFGACETSFGLARPLLGLRDLFWACETSVGLARPLLGLRDLLWACETSFGLARPLLGLRDLFWACETSFGIARPFLGLRDLFFLECWTSFWIVGPSAEL